MPRVAASLPLYQWVEQGSAERVGEPTLTHHLIGGGVVRVQTLPQAGHLPLVVLF